MRYSNKIGQTSKFNLELLCQFDKGLLKPSQSEFFMQ